MSSRPTRSDSAAAGKPDGDPVSIEIVISDMTRADIASMLEIEAESQPEPWTEGSFTEELGRLNSFVYVARCGPGPAGGAGPAIAGYICCWCVADELQILNVAVRKRLRRRGIARALLTHALETGCEKNATTAVLEVRKSNEAARRLYESFGFEVVGERPDYYEVRKEPAVLMALEIPREI